tara:strand:+ start:401 stop:637 length:237 start_codon:yes stop_codon:yes gene_type:complete
MKFSLDQSFPPHALHGAVLTEPIDGKNPSRSFRIIDFEVNVTSHQINVRIVDEENQIYSLPWENLKEWHIQFQHLLPN